MKDEWKRSQAPIAHSRPTIEEDDVQAVVECLRSHRVGAGMTVAALEECVAADSGYRYGVATVNGSQALHLGLRVAFPRGGARVALQSYVCRSVHDAVLLAGCRPVLGDVEASTLSLSAEDPAVGDAEAVVVPHMFGIRAEMEGFRASGALTIEDCAQRIVPRRAESRRARGTLRILSFAATKLLTGGEGGMLLTDDEAWYRRARQLRDAPYDFPEAALWLPYSDLQASLVAAQWRRRDEFLHRRSRLAQFYNRALGESVPGWIFPAMGRSDTHHFRFLLRVPDPDRFMAAGLRRGVVFRRPVAPVGLHTLFKVPGRFPVTDDAMAHIVSIPLYPGLTEAQARVVADAVAGGAQEMAG